MNLIKFILAFVIFANASCQVFNDDNCDSNIETMPNFNQTLFAGNWYETRRTINMTMDHIKCYHAQFTPVDEFGYKVVIIKPTTNKGTVRTHSLTTVITDVNKPERFILSGIQSKPSDLPFWILDTDYENYAISYSCTPFFGKTLRMLSIFLRKKQPDEIITATAANVLKLKVNQNILAYMLDCNA